MRPVDPTSGSARRKSRPHGRGQGFLVELVAKHVPTRAQFASPKPVARWVHVGANALAEELTLGDLALEISEHLPDLGIDTARLAAVLPANARNPIACPDPEARPNLRLLSDLRWTQAERLVLSEVLIQPWENPWADVESRIDTSSTRGGRRVGGAPAPAPDPGCAELQRVVLFRRETERPRSTSSDEFLPVTKKPLISSWEAGAESEEQPLTAEVPNSQRELLETGAVRQFEFHPTVAGLMIAGTKGGEVAVVDYERDRRMQTLYVEDSPVIGLSWLQSQPQWAVVGTCRGGSLRLVRYDGGSSKPMDFRALTSFENLSSLSVNCTDDFLTTSGFCSTIGLYDVLRGDRIATLEGLHQNFTNTTRFAHRSPHLFVTASFDNTCKLWDLRQPVCADRAAAVFKTDTVNVMCTFSPDDSKVLCSGVDSALQQFSLAGAGRGMLPAEAARPHPSGAAPGQPSARAEPGKRFPLQPLHDEQNYRRSLYLATGSVVATAGTQERCIRFYSASSPNHHRGCVDLGQLVARKSAAGGAGPPGSDSWSSGFHVQSLRCHPRDPGLLGAIISSEADSSLVLVRLDDAGDVA